MRSKVLYADGGQTTFLLVFEPGEEAVEGLTRFAGEHDITAAHLTAIGALSRATLGFFDVARKEYQKVPMDEQVELLSMTGNIARDEKEQPKVHAHVVLGKRDGSTVGGHLLEARVRPTLEVILVESPPHLRRRERPEIGLALIDLDPAGE